ncbi:MAG TPA: ABC transporter permease [Ktedonobacterales bacterium]
MAQQSQRVTQTSPQFPSSRRPHPLAAVLTWELRRICASRANWLTAAGAFGACFLITWGDAVVGGIYPLPSPHGTLRFVVPYTSVWGLATTLPESPGIFFGLLFPFMCTDGVARDLRRRTHELMMTTPLPSWAYVWGRSLASLLLSFLLAGLLLVSIMLVTVLLHVTHAGGYPPLVLPSVIAIWALIVLPPMVLLSGFSCALGTLLPRRSNLIKVGVLLAWLVGGESLEVFVLRPENPAWLAQWDPTNCA